MPGTTEHENTYPLGQVIRDLIRQNPSGYKLFGPDETHSNRLQAVYEVSKKVWMANFLPEDLNGSELARDGSVIEMLSEHTLVGMMEGYLYTGRNGFFHTYEASPTSSPRCTTSTANGWSTVRRFPGGHRSAHGTA